MQSTRSDRMRCAAIRCRSPRNWAPYLAPGTTFLLKFLVKLQRCLLLRSLGAARTLLLVGDHNVLFARRVFPSRSPLRSYCVFDVGCLDHLAPLLGFTRDKLLKVDTRPHKRCAAKFGKSRLHHG